MIGSDAPEFQGRLRAEGYWSGDLRDDDALDRIVVQLGSAVLRTDVRPTDTSKSLVCSTRRLGPHTDHFRADFIVWACFEQAARGGETFVVDPAPAFESLSDADQDALRSTAMYEHRIFADDPETRPIVHDDDGGPRFYFTYWLAKTATPEQEAAARRFRDALERAPRLFAARLAPGDVLVVDNRRVLHGREAFSGARHLVRIWVSENQGWEPTWLPRDGGRS